MERIGKKRKGKKRKEINCTPSTHNPFETSAFDTP